MRDGYCSWRPASIAISFPKLNSGWCIDVYDVFNCVPLPQHATSTFSSHRVGCKKKISIGLLRLGVDGLFRSHLLHQTPTGSPKVSQSISSSQVRATHRTSLPGSSSKITLTLSKNTLARFSSPCGTVTVNRLLPDDMPGVW